MQASLAMYGQAPKYQVPTFKDITRSSGLTVPHLSTAAKKYMPESMSGGVGFIDCNNDGKLDIVVVNGSTMKRHLAGQDPPLVTLYEQGRDLKFKNITAKAGLTRKGWGMGVAVADFDNDGNQDLYVTALGGSVLYRNKGNCRFEDVTRKAGVGVGGFTTGAAWGDYDRDGYVDLFVPRYAHFEMPRPGSVPSTCTFMGLKVFCGPWGFPGESDFLFHNNGNGTFENVSKKAGVSDPKHLFGMQGIWDDFNNDGWPDLYVTNDRGTNYLYENQHNGTFKDVGFLSGTMVGQDGNPQGSMGVDAADFLHTGHLSIFVTNFMQESDTLYRNDGSSIFTDISVPSGITKATFTDVGWGTGFEDFTNSGWDDLFVANGHIYPNISKTQMGVHYREPILLFQNNRDGTFRDVAPLTDLSKLPLESRRGVAFGDVNNDGKVDVLMLNVDGPPTLLLNCTQNSNDAVLLNLVGTKSNRDAIGARVTVIAQSLKQMQEVRSGGSYLSQNDLRLHFGLGGHSKIDTIEINWPSGEKQTLQNLAANRIYTIVEGKGVKKSVPFAKSVGCGPNDSASK